LRPAVPGDTLDALYPSIRGNFCPLCQLSLSSALRFPSPYPVLINLPIVFADPILVLGVCSLVKECCLSHVARQTTVFLAATMSRRIDLSRIGSLKRNDRRSVRFQCSNLCRIKKTDPPSSPSTRYYHFNPPLVRDAFLFFNEKQHSEQRSFAQCAVHNFSPSSHLRKMPSNVSNDENCRGCTIVTPTFRRTAIHYLNAISAAIIVTDKSAG